MIPLFQLDGRSTCPLGMAMCQNRLAVPTWSYAMEVYPPARIVEIGGGNGGFTTALALHAKMIGASVISYDRQVPDERIAPVARFLGVDFRRIDDLWEIVSTVGGVIASTGRTYVLCDGGDKKRELAAFAPYLKTGDVIACHDYDSVHEVDPSTPAHERFWPWGECTQAMAAPVAREHELEPFMQEHFDQAGWLAYRRKARR